MFIFWLVKATHITKFNQLLLIKFGKNFIILNYHIIKLMTSKVQPAAD